MEDSVIINRFDSFDEMKQKLGEKPLIFCEEEQSRYAIISRSIKGLLVQPL